MKASPYFPARGRRDATRIAKVLFRGCPGIIASADDSRLRAARPGTRQIPAPAYYKTLVEQGFLPTKPHISDLELAQKLNLELPQLAEVKAAVAKKDQKALEQALGAYLNSRIPPFRIAPTGKPAPNAQLADQWLQPQIVLGGKNYPIAGAQSIATLPLGDDVDWYFGSATAFVEPSQWGVIRIVGNAYANSGDPKYAQAMIRFVRSFYRTAARLIGLSGDCKPTAVTAAEVKELCDAPFNELMMISASMGVTKSSALTSRYPNGAP